MHAHTHTHTHRHTIAYHTFRNTTILHATYTHRAQSHTHTHYIYIHVTQVPCIRKPTSTTYIIPHTIPTHVYTLWILGTLPSIYDIHIYQLSHAQHSACTTHIHIHTMSSYFILHTHQTRNICHVHHTTHISHIVRAHT